jgi:hypothetical protein
MVDFTFQGSDTGVARWQEALKVGRTLSPTFQARTAQSLHCAASKPSPSIGLSFAKFTYRVTAARPRRNQAITPYVCRRAARTLSGGDPCVTVAGRFSSIGVSAGNKLKGRKQ